MNVTTPAISQRALDLPPGYSVATSLPPYALSPPLVRLATSEPGHHEVLEDAENDEELDLRRPTHGSIANPRREAETVDRPPTYTPFDDQANVYSMCNGVINIVGANHVEKPRYQLRQHVAKSGRLWKLQIRRLLPSESRRLSMSSRHIDFDADTMLYEAENLAALYSLRNRMEVQIKGRKAGTVQGHIEVRDKGRAGCEFLQCTRPASRHWLREENMKRMNKWGWKADDELEKTLLLSCRAVGRKGNVEWKYKDQLTDVIGVIAIELDGELVLQKQISETLRDTLVTCWAIRYWMKGLSSGKAPEVTLSRPVTVG